MEAHLAIAPEIHAAELVIFVTRGRTVLDITIESSHGVVTVRCYGRLVYGCESAVFRAVVPRAPRDVIVDLSGVTAIDAAGIGALVSLQTGGTHLRLVEPSETVRQALRLTNLDSIFDPSASKCGRDPMFPNATGQIGIHSSARISG